MPICIGREGRVCSFEVLAQPRLPKTRSHRAFLAPSAALGSSARRAHLPQTGSDRLEVHHMSGNGWPSMQNPPCGFLLSEAKVLGLGGSVDLVSPRLPPTSVVPARSRPSLPHPVGQFPERKEPTVLLWGWRHGSNSKLFGIAGGRSWGRVGWRSSNERQKAGHRN